MKTFTTMTAGELIAGIENEAIKRMTEQRTPSHTPTTALAILTSMAENKFCGVITLAQLPDGTLAIVDGSSRLHDIQHRDTIKGYSDFTPEAKAAILCYEFDVIILPQLSDVERAQTFLNANSSTAMSGIQKHKGLGGDCLNSLSALITDSDFYKILFTDRVRQKDLSVDIAAQVIANAHGVYTASAAKLMEHVKPLTIDLEYIAGVISKLDVLTNAKENEVSVLEGWGKYNVITALSIFARNKLNYDTPQKGKPTALYPLSAIERMGFAISTAGANSIPQNDARLVRGVKEVNNFIKEINFKPAPAPVVTAEQSMDDIAGLLKGGVV